MLQNNDLIETLTMKNAFAVYSSKPALKGKKLTEVAEADGLQIRFLAMGGYIPSNPEETLNKSLAATKGGGHLIVGAWEEDQAVLAEFDEHIQNNDRLPIAEILSGGTLPFCELYTSRFNYEKEIKSFPKAKAGIDGSVAKQELPALKSSKTRYIIYNQSRTRNGTKLMRQLTDLIASATAGLVADYQRPRR